MSARIEWQVFNAILVRLPFRYRSIQLSSVSFISNILPPVPDMKNSSEESINLVTLCAPVCVHAQVTQNFTD